MTEDKKILFLLGENNIEEGITVKKGSLLDRFLLLLDNHKMYEYNRKIIAGLKKKDRVEFLDNVLLFIDDSYRTTQVVAIYNLFLDAGHNVSSFYKIANTDEARNDLRERLAKVYSYRNNVIAHTNKNFNTNNHNNDTKLSGVELKSYNSNINGERYKDIDFSIDDIIETLPYLIEFVESVMQDLLDKDVNKYIKSIIDSYK